MSCLSFTSCIAPMPSQHPNPILEEEPKKIQNQNQRPIFWRIKRYSQIIVPPPENQSMQIDSTVSWKDTSIFIPPISQGVVIKVYDGDTITIAAHMPIPDTPLYRFSVRLLGIDCAEIKGKTVAEKEIASKARLALSTKILNKTVELKNVSLEKYGRLLADIYLDGIHLNQWMIDNGYAIAYDGGTKSRPDEWDA